MFEDCYSACDQELELFIGISESILYGTNSKRERNLLGGERVCKSCLRIFLSSTGWSTQTRNFLTFRSINSVNHRLVSVFNSVYSRLIVSNELLIVKANLSWALKLKRIVITEFDWQGSVLDKNSLMILKRKAEFFSRKLGYS